MSIFCKCLNKLIYNSYKVPNKVTLHAKVVPIEDIIEPTIGEPIYHIEGPVRMIRDNNAPRRRRDDIQREGVSRVLIANTIQVY